MCLTKQLWVSSAVTLLACLRLWVRIQYPLTSWNELDNVNGSRPRGYDPLTSWYPLTSWHPFDVMMSIMYDTHDWYHVLMTPLTWWHPLTATVLHISQSYIRSWPSYRFFFWLTFVDLVIIFLYESFFFDCCNLQWNPYLMVANLPLSLARHKHIR